MTDLAALQRSLAGMQAALGAGRLDDARRDLAALRKAGPRNPVVLQYAGRLARAEGDPRGAIKSYEKALRLAPGEAGLWAEYAATLDDAGRAADALQAYDRALALAPGLVEAAIDRAVLLARQPGEGENGRAALRAIAAVHPGHARAWRNLAILEREALDAAAASAAARQVLALIPGDARALALDALARFDAGLPSVAAFVAASKAAPSDRALLVKCAAACHAEGGSEGGIALLERLVAAHPFDAAAQRALAQLRYEAGAGDNALAGYEAACRLGACPAEIWRDHVRLAERYRGPGSAQEVAGRAAAALGPGRDADFIRALAACEAEDFAAYEPLFAALATWREPGADRLRLRWLGRMHRFDELAALAQKLQKAGHGREALAYLALGWRGMDDPRWHWLERDGDLVGTVDIAGRLRDPAALANRLRTIHRSQRQPLEQSLRGGTQTDGHLFARSEAEITDLRKAVTGAVADYLAALPPHDPRHPFLGLTRRIDRFAGAWSVRLSDAGFHVAHVHPQGDLSSAGYVVLPETLGRGDGDVAGWLSVGEPPAEFALDWAPLRLIEPREGMLALFPSWQWHGTRPFPAGERLTFAFDVTLG